MLRPVTYLLFGWLLLAAAGGLAQSLQLTLVLPATSAVLVTHMAFSKGMATPLGLALAIGLGYLEDVHQGAPGGTLTLAHALAFLFLRWASGRVALPGWISRATAALVAVVLIDLLTWLILLALEDILSLRRDALVLALSDVKWHGLATLFAAPPIWALMDRLIALAKLSDRTSSFRGTR
jgi:hypothetical protein